jgi:flagellar motor component MotA
MLKNLDDPNALGTNMAVALLSFLYAALINLFLILPYVAITKQRLAESEL